MRKKIMTIVSGALMVWLLGSTAGVAAQVSKTGAMLQGDLSTVLSARRCRNGKIVLRGFSKGCR
uniref:Uncharacterized protein n=1 Tax=Candidatus Kentrum sp. FM TaxID=2126340 RepID=A0A450VZT1_9GAMM|nr:MAG: hypothetical protein BECKFM1743A_GA0114220_104095 [Candidatus Kentron sp. FM]VFK10318.1 MAG: hypothetical protein BECKFM1743B_GA0114221_101355 [Candidatus Kentron sp. FM]